MTRASAEAPDDMVAVRDGPLCAWGSPCWGTLLPDAAAQSKETQPHTSGKGLVQLRVRQRVCAFAPAVGLIPSQKLILSDDEAAQSFCAD